MSYAILISGQATTDLIQQIIIANHDNKNYVWTRTTNGGRGESNAWFVGDYNNLLSYPCLQFCFLTLTIFLAY